MSHFHFTEDPEYLINQAKKYHALQSRHLKSAEKINLLEPGQRVEHSVFGVGTVLDINMEEESYQILFDGMATPRQIAMKVKMNMV